MVLNLKEPNSRLVRWKLEEYYYEIMYQKKTKHITNADAPSKIELNDFENEFLIVNVGHDVILESILQNPTLPELDQQELNEMLPQTSGNNDNETVHSSGEIKFSTFL